MIIKFKAREEIKIFGSPGKEIAYIFKGSEKVYADKIKSITFYGESCDYSCENISFSDSDNNLRYFGKKEDVEKYLQGEETKKAENDTNFVEVSFDIGDNIPVVDKKDGSLGKITINGIVFTEDRVLYKGVIEDENTLNEGIVEVAENGKVVVTEVDLCY